MENSVQSWHRHTSPNHLIRPHQHIRRDRHGKIVTAPGAVSSDVFSHSRRTHIANPDLNGKPIPVRFRAGPNTHPPRSAKAQARTIRRVSHDMSEGNASATAAVNSYSRYRRALETIFASIKY